jgi:beta-N-acetylhexosaminidase
MTRADRWRAAGLAGVLTATVPALLGLVLAGCGGGDTEPQADGPALAATASATASGVASPATAPAPPSTTAPASSATPSSTAGAAEARLPASLEQSAARVLLVGFGGAQATPETLALLARHDWGGVVLAPGNGTSPEQVAALVQQVIATAAQAGHPAPLVAASQPGGVANAVPVGPPVQATLPDAAAAQLAARQAAGRLRQLGVRLVLAPDADAGAAGGPWEGRAFSDDPGVVASLTAAAVTGWMRGGVAPAPGHFPGEGAASGDPALEPATVGLSLDELRQRDLQPFAALAKRVPAMQLSAATFVAFDGVTPATLLPDAVTLLRQGLGFGGVVVSGDLAAASLASGQSVGDVAVAALAAGCDLLWIPGGPEDQEAAWAAIVRAVRGGDVPKWRLADALRRADALRARYRVG